MKENEIKLKIQDPAAAREHLSEIGAILNRARHFEDNFLFDTPENDLRNNRKLLRVRIVDGAAVFTFKEQSEISEGIKVREEIETNASSPEDLIEILKRIGFQITFRYQKYRTIFEIPGAALHVCLDETPIGHFFELEGEPDQIHVYARRLGYGTNDYIASSYAAVYIEWCRMKGLAPRDMIFP